ncbi:MAG: sarcosine oxidase subunit gamma [Albidovulum sp.]
MAKLIARSACEDLLPISIGGMELTEQPIDRMWAIAPYHGREKAVSTALQKQGLDWPAPNTVCAKGDKLCMWSGRAQAFLVNAELGGLKDAAALTDISDGWIAIVLTGAKAASVLARLVPVDLGQAACSQGSVLRTGLGHMSVMIHRTGPAQFTIYLFRSMAATAVHELSTAMHAVTARAAI